MLTSRYRLNAPTCIQESIEHDVVVINLDTGSYYNMRGTSALLWDALIAGVIPSELAQAGGWNHEQRDALEQHLQRLLTEGLLVVASSSDAPPMEPTLITLDGNERPFDLEVFTDLQEMLLLDPIHDADTSGLGWPHRR